MEVISSTDLLEQKIAEAEKDAEFIGWRDHVDAEVREKFFGSFVCVEVKTRNIQHVMLVMAKWRTAGWYVEHKQTGDGCFLIFRDPLNAVTVAQKEQGTRIR